MKKTQKNSNWLVELVTLVNVYQSLKNGGCPSTLTDKLESLIETAISRVK